MAQGDQGLALANDEDRCRIVAEYFRQSRVFDAPTAALRTPADHRSDPLYAAWAVVS